MQIVSRAAAEAERHSAACLSQPGEEKRRRRAAESEVERLRCQNAELTAKAALWKNDGKNLHAELERMNTLSEAYTVTRRRIKELEKKLNSATTSSRCCKRPSNCDNRIPTGKNT